MKTLSRDPYARLDYIRESVTVYAYSDVLSCQHCGGKGKRLVSGYYRLYRYGIYQDGLYTRPVYDPELFCSKSCHDSYYS